MNTLTRWINAELARDGLRLAADDEPAWLEYSSAGLVRATDAELPMTQELATVALEWNEAAGIGPMTATILKDLWAQEGGPRKVAEILATMLPRQRNRLAVDYWHMLRAERHDVSLAQIGLQFHLLMSWAA